MNLTELDILKDVVHRFEKAGCNYMLTGSMAMNYYAEPRMTRDIDLVVELTGADAQKLLSLFSDDYYISDEAIDDAINQSGMFNLIHLDSVVKVDVIVRKADEYRRSEFKRRHRIELADFNLWIVSKDLILSKLLWAQDSNSELQLRDVENLLSTGADMAYLKSWVEKLKVSDLFWKVNNG